jgi:peptidyl-prolyl cis-trans isomerase B (cyclophilin B)
MKEKEAKKNSVIAILSFIAGLISFVPFYGFLFGFAGIVLGVIALSFKKEREKKGRGFAIAGLILGVIGIIINLIILFLFSVLASVAT